ncbi:MAG: PEGA domain-containing protein [Myxococcota bacterium]
MKDMQALIDKATQAYGAARYEEALISLRRAERKAEDAGQLDFLASIRFNIARCLEQLGRKKEALEAYRAYDKLPDLPHRKQKAFASIEKLQADVLGVLAVTCQQEGSSVLVLEVSDAAQSCPFRSRGLDPGRYEVEVDAPGHLKSVRAVQIRAGATTAVDFDLSPQPAAPPTAARAPGVVVADAPGPPRELSPWPWVTMGTGAALVGLGAVFNVIGSEQINDANELPPTQERADLVSGSETNEALTYALYGVGAAAAAGGLVWLIIDMTSGGEAEALGFHANAQGIEVRF